MVKSDVATFSDSDNASCAANPKDAHQMVCTPFGGTFVPGQTFDVHLRFTAPASGAQVLTSASISVAAKTVGGPNNNGTTLATTPPLPTNIVAGGDKSDTYLHANENAGTGSLSTSHPQNFGLQLPTTLLGVAFGVALSIHDNVGHADLRDLPTVVDVADDSGRVLGNAAGESVLQRDVRSTRTHGR